jgi:betaine-aldehyde dehydrogenase
LSWELTMQYQKLFIGGNWQAPSSDRQLEVENPANREITGHCPEAVEDDVDAAVAAAQGALKAPDWAALAPAQRADLIDALGASIKARAKDLANCAVQEIGAPISFSMGQVAMARMTLKFFAQQARELNFEEQRKGFFGQVLVRKEPVGVVAAIVPYNGPLFAGMLKIGPALASGCTVVLKVPVETPLFSYILAECIEEAGIPGGVINILASDRSASEYLVSHAGVNMATITGSLNAGRRVAEVCGAQVKRAALELGGKSAAIVCEDAVLADVVPGLANAAVINSGQACAAQTRILIPRSRYEEFVQAIAAAFEAMKLGDPASADTQLGPMIHEQHLNRVKEYVDLGVSEGARLVTGGGTPEHLKAGYYIEPTLLADVSNHMRVAREEIFGPVVCAIPYSDIDEAISIANDSDMGLSGSVWTADVEQGLKVARRIETGNFSINGFSMDVAAPFGGYKSSGLGRELGEEGMYDYLEFKTINLPAPAQ